MGATLPPTQFLPRLGRSLSSYPPATLAEHILKLSQIFQPPVHGTSEEAVVDSGYSTPADAAAAAADAAAAAASKDNDGEDDDEASADEYEHKHSRGWLERIVMLGGEWCEETDDGAEREHREQVVEAAAALVAVWSGTSAAGAILREIALPHEVNIIVNDAPYLSSSHDSVGVQTWGSSILLARRILNFPDYFLPTLKDKRPLRILELGAGTGVVSLALVQSPLDVLKGVSVDATDYHPDVLSNLSKNAALNLPYATPSSPPPDGTTRFTSPTSSGTLTVRPLDWLSYVTTGPLVTVGRDGTRDRSASPSLLGETSERNAARFDVLIAADCVYETHHAGWIKETVKALLRLPDGDDLEGGVFHCFMPLRPTHVREVESVQLAFPLAAPPPAETSYFPHFPADSAVSLLRSASGSATRPYSPSLLAPPNMPTRNAGDKWVLRTLETQDFKAGLERGVGRRDEMGYRRFKIGWVPVEVDAGVGLGEVSIAR